MAFMSPPWKSTRPMEPQNSVSPEMSTGAPSGFVPKRGSRNRQMPPSVCPGVRMTFHGMFPIFRMSPSFTTWSTGHGVKRMSSRGSFFSPVMMGASMAEAITMAPVLSRSSFAAPTWSEWRCVRMMASTVRLPTALRISSALHDGSTTMVAAPSEMMYTLFSIMPSTRYSTGTQVPFTLLVMRRS